MKCLDFNQNWSFRPLNIGTAVKTETEAIIEIPHDAMFHENRSGNHAGRGNISWFSGGTYEYEKIFTVPEEYRNKHIVFEFEGVYRNPEVFINGEKAAYRPYGYTNFYVEADSYLLYNTENIIKVIANNSDQPNSRWYSGSGIYRPVHMYVMEKQHILLNGIKVKTVSITPAIISVEILTSHPGNLKVEILENNALIAQATGETTGKKIFQIEIQGGKLWSPENPFLYHYQVTFQEEVVKDTFGIRQILWNSENGFTINNKRAILKGACIHHDNGLLGACAYEDAEKRKVRLLQEVGYNAIRSAHNPCSKAMLRACDEMGMLVMDEYVDMWYIHKTKYDYADYFQDWWQQDLKDMVDKDYNHPCVILYSTGNEVSETAQEKGIQITGEMTEYLHSLDDTRPVSCGVNIFFNFLSSIGFGVYSDKKANENDNSLKEEHQSKKEPVGSEFYNTLAGLLGDKAMKIGATFHGCDVRTREAFARMDVAGYNYGILRYLQDLKKYPNRLILGSETFCRDAYDFMEMAKKNTRIIGDFVWAGMDYLGEVGIGAWVYEDYAPKIKDEAGWLTAGSGRIDITGRAGGEAAYTKVALEKTEGPLIAVKPVYQNGKHSPSAWKLTDAIESWTWPGCENQKAIIEIYARADSVKVFINDKFVVRKKLKNTCRTIVKAPYQKGKITVISYNKNHKEIGNYTLKTAGEETILNVLPEEKTVSPNGLNYIRIAYTDLEGIVKPMEKHQVKVTVENGTLLALGNACPYNPEGYGSDNTKTYYGDAMAVVQANAVEKNKEVVQTNAVENVLEAVQADKASTREVIIKVTDGERENRICIPIVQ